jgi:hypothetical protein
MLRTRRIASVFAAFITVLAVCMMKPTSVCAQTITITGTTGSGGSGATMTTAGSVTLFSVSGAVTGNGGSGVTASTAGTIVLTSPTTGGTLTHGAMSLPAGTTTGGTVFINNSVNSATLNLTSTTITTAGSINIAGSGSSVFLNHPPITLTNPGSSLVIGQTPQPPPVPVIPVSVNVVQQQISTPPPVIPIPVLLEILKAATETTQDFASFTTNINTVGEFTEQLKASMLNPNSPNFQPNIPQLSIVPEAQNIQMFDEKTPNAIQGDYQPIAFVYPTSVKTDVQLKEGSVLFAPSKLTSVSGRFGRVAINKDAVVLIVNTKDGMSVYDIHDAHDGDVLIAAGDRTFALNPGRNAIIADGDVTALEHINPLGCIAYRNAQTDKLPNGTTRIRSEFWIPTALKGLKLYQRIDPAIREKVLKNAAALAYMRQSATKFQFVARTQK